jgi:hypothetical protein
VRDLRKLWWAFQLRRRKAGRARRDQDRASRCASCGAALDAATRGRTAGHRSARGGHDGPAGVPTCRACRQRGAASGG